MDSKTKALENRIRDLEWALDYEKKHSIEAQKQIYKRDRKIRELLADAENFEQTLKNTQSLVQDLESKLRVYKSKLDEAQGICTQNADRFRFANQKYLDEVAKTEVFEEQIRRRRAMAQNTPLFFQI